MLPQCWSPEGVSWSELHISLCAGPLRRTAWDFRNPPSHSAAVPSGFVARSYGNFSSWHWNSRMGCQVWCWEPLLPIRDLYSWSIPPNFYPPHVGVGPASSTSLPLLPVSMWLICLVFTSLVVALPFSWISGSFEWLLFCGLVAILMLWEEASNMFTYIAIFPRSARIFFFRKKLLWRSAEILIELEKNH